MKLKIVYTILPVQNVTPTVIFKYEYAGTKFAYDTLQMPNIIDPASSSLEDVLLDNVNEALSEHKILKISEHETSFFEFQLP